MSRVKVLPMSCVVLVTYVPDRFMNSYKTIVLFEEGSIYARSTGDTLQDVPGLET
jgi:hypothetical protein